MLTEVKEIAGGALNLAGLVKVVKGAGIAGGGAAVVAALMQVGLLPENLNVTVALALGALASSGINFFKVWLLKYNIVLEVSEK